jgi:hypothetical protein
MIFHFILKILENMDCNSNLDGLNYLYDYIPKVSTLNVYQPSCNEVFEEEYRTITK